MSNRSCCSKCLSVVVVRFGMKTRPVTINKRSQAALAGKAVFSSRKVLFSNVDYQMMSISGGTNLCRQNVFRSYTGATW
jgi:hypothetical protein